MKKLINYKKEIPIEDSVSSITSISLECIYNEDRNNVDGQFIIEGSYKTHELSLNKKDFKFELPFTNELENYKKETASVEIEDFTYDLEDNNLIIDIDYELSYEDEEIQEEFNEEEFERFLSEHEVDVVSFKEDENIIEPEEKSINEDNSVRLVEEIIIPEKVEDPEEIAEIEENPELEEREITLEPQESNESVEETLLNNI